MFENIAIYGNQKIENLKEIEKEITELLKKMGKNISQISEKTDLLITIGGDGTLLKGFGMIKNENTCILGLNFGRFGFLINDCPNIEKFFTDIFSGRFISSERMFLKGYIEKQEGFVPIGKALNEIIVFRKDIRILDIEIEIDNIPLSVRADGLIVSTSTGSTAHSFSAGGPALPPDMDSILIVCEAPFTPSWKNFLYNKDTIYIRTKKESDVVFDGQTKYSILPEQRLMIKRSKEKCKIIFNKQWNFWKTIKEKFQ